MDALIREAEASDMPQVLELIRQLAHFEREENAVEITAADLVRDGFGNAPKFHCFVAQVAGSLAGIALTYPRYSTWKGPSLHLEDLIVKDTMRGRGIGTALLDAVINYGADQGVKRISWEVLDWNEPAIVFYEAKGAQVLRDWNVVHLDETAIAAYLRAAKT